MIEGFLLDSHSFVVGFCSGAIIVSVLGYLFTSTLKNYEDSKVSGKKVSVKVQGEDSPRQIMQKSAQATGCLTCSLFLLVILFAGMAIVLYQIWIL